MAYCNTDENITRLHRALCCSSLEGSHETISDTQLQKRK